MNYTKPHYVCLDGLRGVAALMVLVFHVFDACSANILPHGYLAVDFFFVLSGFVIGYAYDDRWKVPQKEGGLTIWTFFRRRLIRLHPMVLAGALVGFLAFMAAGGQRWDGTPVPLGWTLVAFFCTMLMIPALPGASTEVRGFGEYFPLNGPFWSLFYEYTGNILYALLLRRLSARWLGLVAAVSGAFVIQTTLECGYLGVGWSAADGGWWYGFVRMLFPYCVGMLMARHFRSLQVKHAFWWCGLAIWCVGLLPVVGGEDAPWLNGLLDAFCVIVVFPALVWLAASDVQSSSFTLGLSRRLGDLSYPLYAIHYPFMSLLFFRLGFDGNLLPRQTVFDHWPLALLPVCCALLLACLLTYFYDKPLRRWLSKTG